MSNGDDKKFDLGKTIGAIESNIGHIKEAVDGVNGKVDTIKEKLIQLNGSAVKHDQCEARTGRLAKKVDQLRGEVARKQTRNEVPSIAPLLDDTAEVEVVEEDEPDKKSLLIRAKENVSSIVVILGALGLLGTGFYKLAHILVNVEQAVVNQNKKQTKAIKQELQKVHTTPPRVIYLPVYPDASVKKRTPRRRHR